MQSCSRDDIAPGGSFAGGPCHQDDYGVDRRAGFISMHLATSKTVELLDVGCGHGAYLDSLLPQASRVVGIDINESYIRGIKQRVTADEIQLAVLDAQEMAFKDCSFDVVIAIEVLEHIPNEEKFVSEIFRSLKPGGKFLLSVPNKLFFFETHPIRMHSRLVGSRWGTGIPLLPLLPRWVRRHFATVHLYTPRGLTALLCGTGFRIEEISWLMPSLDSLEHKTPWYRGKQRTFALIRRLFELLEKSALRRFGSTITLCAEKPGS
jgi:SAM-dependent methyltransferase